MQASILKELCPEARKWLSLKGAVIQGKIATVNIKLQNGDFIYIGFGITDAGGLERYAFQAGEFVYFTASIKNNGTLTMKPTITVTDAVSGAVVGTFIGDSDVAPGFGGFYLNKQIGTMPNANEWNLTFTLAP